MLIFKVFGIFLIVLSCAALGFLKSFSTKARYKKLFAFCEGLNMLYEYISQGEYMLDDAIKKAFSKCSFIMLQNNIIACCDTDLNQEDKTAINEFFASLGRSPKKVECDRIRLFAINIKKRLTDAENDIAQKGKIYQTFGICIGLALGILLA